MLLVWFPKLGSSLPGSQVGNPRQAKQSISTHRNPAAQPLLKAGKLQASWFPGQGAGELGAVFTDGPRVLVLGRGGGQGRHLTMSQALIHSALQASGWALQFRQPGRPLPSCSGPDSLFPLLMAKALSFSLLTSN